MRIGIIGAGTMAQAHAESFAAINGVSVVAFAARTLRNSERLARQFGARATTNLNDVLHDDTIDAVSVCIPDPEQCGVVTAALRANKHVYCEAGPGGSLEDAQAMLDAAGHARKVLAVAYFWRTLHEVRVARQLVESGELGRLRSVFHHRRFGENVDPFDIAGTDGDVVTWLAGVPLSATASQSPDGRHVIIATKHQETLGVIEVVTRLPLGYPHTAGYRLTFDRGALEFDISFANQRPPQWRFVRYTAGGEEHLTLPDEGPWYRNGCRYFIDAVRGDADPELLSFQHALIAAKTIRAARRSLQTAAAVEVI